MGKLGKNYLLNTIYQLCAIFVPLLTAPYLTRVLTANNYGIYSYVQSTAGIVQTLTLVGLYSYGNRQIAYKRDNFDDLSQTFWEIMFLRFILGIFSTIIYVILSIVSDYTVYFLLYYPFVLSYIIDCSWIYVGMENMGPCVTKNIIAKILTLVGVFALVKSTGDVWKYILLVACSSLICNLAVYTQLKGIIKKPIIDKKNINQHLKGSIYLFLPQVASLIYLQMDKAMLGAMTGAINEVSFYDQAEKLVTIAFSLITAISTVMMPRLANEYHKGNDEKVEYYLTKVGKISLAMAIPMMIGMMLIATRLIPWYLGSEYMPSAYALILISPLAVTNTMIGISGNQYFIATNKIKILTISNSIAAGCNLLLNAALIPKLGYMGAAIATLASSIVNVTIQFVYLNRFVKVKKMVFGSLKYLLMSIIMGSVIIMVTRVLALGASVFTTLIQIFVGIITYVIILVITRDELTVEISEMIKAKKK